MSVSATSGPLRSRLVCKVLVIYSTFTVVESCGQTPTTSAKSQEKIQWAGHALSEVRTLRKLPPAIQAVLGVGTPGMGGIADRNGKYNATDVVFFSHPMRRFLIAGLDGDTTLVAIERGGIGWNVEVSLFNKTAVERNWTLFKSPKTLRELVDLLAACEERPPIFIPSNRAKPSMLCPTL